MHHLHIPRHLAPALLTALIVFSILPLRMRFEQIHDMVDEFARIELGNFKTEIFRLDLGEIENVIGHDEKRFATDTDQICAFALLRIERSREELVAQPNDAIQGRAKLVAHVAQKFRFRPTGSLGGKAGVLDCSFIFLSLGCIDKGDDAAVRAAVFVVNRCGGVFDGKTRPIFSPKDLVFHMTGNSIPKGGVDGAFLDWENAAVSAVVMHHLVGMLANQFRNFIAKHFSCCGIFKTNHPLGADPVDAFTDSVQNRLILVAYPFQFLCREYPASLVEVSNMYPSAQLTAMQAEFLDGGFIVTQPMKPIKGLAFVDWGQEPLLLVLPEEHSLTRIGKLLWQHLQGLPWVMISHQDAPHYRDLLFKIMESHGLAVQIVQEANTIPTVLFMVAAGTGVAMVPQSAKHLFAPGVVFRQLPDPQPILHRVFAYRAGQDSPVLDKFLSLLRTSAQ